MLSDPTYQQFRAALQTAAQAYQTALWDYEAARAGAQAALTALELAEDRVILDGLLDGKNEVIRAAQLRLHTAAERQAEAATELARHQADTARQCARIAWQLARAEIALLNGEVGG